MKYCIYNDFCLFARTCLYAYNEKNNYVHLLVGYNKVSRLKD